MKTKIKTILAATLTAGICHAAIVVETSFGGTAADPTGDTGLSGDWVTTAGGTTASDATFIPGDMSSLPTAYTNSGFVNSGNHIETFGTPAFRTLSSAIGNETAGTVYFSFLYRVTGSEENTSSGGGLSFFSGTTERVQVGLGQQQSIRVFDVAGNGQTTTANGSFVAGTDTAWVIGRIQTAAGNDTVSIRVFTGTDALADTSDEAAFFSGVDSATRSFALGGALDTIRFNSPTAAGRDPQQFDEFRMGTSLDVVAIPEPSSLALIGLAAAAGMLFLRRRR